MGKIQPIAERVINDFQEVIELQGNGKYDAAGTMIRRLVERVANTIFKCVDKLQKSVVRMTRLVAAIVVLIVLLAIMGCMTYYYKSSPTVTPTGKSTQAGDVNFSFALPSGKGYDGEKLESAVLKIYRSAGGPVVKKAAVHKGVYTTVSGLPAGKYKVDLYWWGSKMTTHEFETDASRAMESSVELPNAVTVRAKLINATAPMAEYKVFVSVNRVRIRNSDVNSKGTVKTDLWVFPVSGLEVEVVRNKEMIKTRKIKQDLKADFLGQVNDVKVDLGQK